MKKTTYPVFYLCILLSVALQALSAAFLEEGTNYFRYGVPFPILNYAVALLCGIVGTVCAIRTKPEALHDTVFRGFPTGLFSAIGAVGCAYLLYVSSENKLAFASVVLCAVFGVYELLVSVPILAKKAGAFLILLGFAGIVVCALLNAYYYFDVTVEMNSPIKVALQIGLLFEMLRITGELRYLLGRQIPRMYQIFSVWAAGAALPSLYVVVFLLLNPQSPRNDYLAGAVFLLSSCCGTLIRLYGMHRSGKELA